MQEYNGHSSLTRGKRTPERVTLIIAQGRVHEAGQGASLSCKFKHWLARFGRASWLLASVPSGTDARVRFPPCPAGAWLVS